MSSKTVFGFWMGVGVGLTAACLMAPLSGNNARNLMGKKVKRLKQNADDLLDSASDLVDRGRSELSKQHEGVMNAAMAGKKAYEKTVS